jgi:hypothetical protein
VICYESCCDIVVRLVKEEEEVVTGGLAIIVNLLLLTRISPRNMPPRLRLTICHHILLIVKIIKL